MTTGLLVFTLMIGSFAIGLLIDLVLLLTGRRTITDRIEGSPHCRAIVVVLTLWILIGASGFVYHFVSR